MDPESSPRGRHELKQEREPTGIAEIFRKSGPYLNLGFGLAVPIILGAFLGHWLDGKWGTGPALTLVGIVVGMVAGFYNFFRVVLRKP